MDLASTRMGMDTLATSRMPSPALAVVAPGQPDHQALVRAHLPMVLATCRRLLRHADWAEDAAQETFLQALRTPPPPVGEVGAWLHQVAVSKAIDLLRREQALQARARRAADRAQETPAEPDGLLALLDACLLELPDASRRVLVEHFLEGCSQAELAARLGISQPSISRRIGAALADLRARLVRRGVAAEEAAIVGGLVAVPASSVLDACAQRLAERMATHGAAHAAAHAAVYTAAHIAAHTAAHTVAASHAPSVAALAGLGPVLAIAATVIAAVALVATTVSASVPGALAEHAWTGWRLTGGWRRKLRRPRRAQRRWLWAPGLASRPSAWPSTTR